VQNGDQNDVTLDLSCLAPYTLDAKDGEDPPHDYFWSVCRNDQNCNDHNDNPVTVMVKQTSPTDADACYWIASWDADKTPQYRDEEDGTWEFVYDTGDDDCGSPQRTWSPTFVCAPGTNYELGAVEEIPGSCYYRIVVKTQFACLNQTYPCVPPPSGGDDESGLSGGWIFIICLVGFIFLYCVAGYFIMGLTVNKAGGLGDFSNNIPQKTFWIALPSLVIAGCGFTKDFIMGLFNKGGGGEEPLVTESAGGDE